MGGSNPYIEKVQYAPATKKFKVTFVREGKTVEVDPEKVPYAREGLPGSLWISPRVSIRVLTTPAGVRCMLHMPRHRA